MLGRDTCIEVVAMLERKDKNEQRGKWADGRSLFYTNTYMNNEYELAVYRVITDGAEKFRALTNFPGSINRSFPSLLRGMETRFVEATYISRFFW